MSDLDLSGDESAQVHDANGGSGLVGGQTADFSNQQPPSRPPESLKVLDYSEDQPAGPPPPPPDTSEKYNAEKTRENTRGDLARGLLLLLAFAVGGVIVFIGLGRLDGTVLTQSIFPSLVALAGTALGFYFGSQTAKESGSSPGAAATNGTASTGDTQSGDRSSAGTRMNPS